MKSSKTHIISKSAIEILTALSEASAEGHDRKAIGTVNMILDKMQANQKFCNSVCSLLHSEHLLSEKALKFVSGISDNYPEFMDKWQASLASVASDLLKTTLPSTRQFNDRLEGQHAKGRIAIHTTPSPDAMYDKFDDKRILNNLREDGGTTARRDGYQLYTIISTTMLPKRDTRVQQQLYEQMGSIFFAIDVENTRFKSFSGVDAWAKYGVKNAAGRPSYKPTKEIPDVKGMTRNDEIKSLTHQEAMKYVDSMNQRSTNYATAAKKSRLFGSTAASFSRGMNETLLKVNSESVLSLGVTAASVRDNPQQILELILYQRKLFEHIGTVLPINIFNNLTDGISINTLDKYPIEIHCNQFMNIDVMSCLSRLREMYPDGVPVTKTFTSINDYEQVIDVIPWNMFYEKMKYPLDNSNHPIIPSETELQKLATQERVGFLHEIEVERKNLKEALPALPPDVLVINREGKHSVSKDDHYIEIKQDNLRRFIVEKILLLPMNTPLAHHDQTKLDHLVKAYNLQYRLDVYADIAKNQSALLNRSKLKEDLQWCQKLLPSVVKVLSGEMPVDNDSKRMPSPK